MDNKFLKNLACLIGVAEAGWAIFNWLSGSKSIFGYISIGAAEWFALFLVGVMIAYWGSFHAIKNIVQGQTPSYRFRKLEIEIHIHRSSTESCIRYTPESSSELMEHRQSLIYSLDKLKIKHPEINDSHRIWFDYLTNLRPLAMHGKVKEARQLYDDITLA